MNILTITTARMLHNDSVLTDGHYNIGKHGHLFKYEDKTYTYHGSGVARTVYVSDCGKFVIKVPNGHVMEDAELLAEYLKNDFKYADPTILHNIGEAQAYKDCPDEYKTYLAKSEILPNCWVRQEFVKVIPCSFTGMVDLREIGQREDGSFCIFDFDPLLTDFVWKNRCNWEQIKKTVEAIGVVINSRK